MRPGHVFSKPFIIALRRLAVVGLESAACWYCASSGLYVCAIILFVTGSDCCVFRGTSQIPVFLFLVSLIISFPLFWTDIYFLSSVTVNLKSHNTPNDISGAVLIFVKMWIYLACLLRPGIWSVAMCEDSIVLPFGSLDIISFKIITRTIVVVACFSRCILSLESAIASMLLI